jgi:hypothetical protein
MMRLVLTQVAMSTQLKMLRFVVQTNSSSVEHAPLAQLEKPTQLAMMPQVATLLATLFFAMQTSMW